MKYLLLVYGAEETYTDQEREECMQESAELCQEMSEKGQYLLASPLHPVATATSVRVREGQRQVTDGPFAETTEQLGGFYLIDVPTLDDAITFAARIPPAKKGTVEVRPVFEMENLPASAT